MPEFKHGASGYTNHRCRCGVCREAYRLLRRNLHARRRAALEVGENGRPYAPWVARHGLNAYINHHCRCDVCTTAGSQHNAQVYRNKKERLATAP